MSDSSPRFILLSERLYRCLLRLGPADYNNAYTEQTVQVFRQWCLDAYRQRGNAGVLALWPFLFSEAFSGMLAERFSAERMRSMLPAARRSFTLMLTAFVIFALAYLFLLRIIDPLPSFEAVARVHTEIGWAYTLIRSSASLACLLLLGGVLLILFSMGRYALTTRHRDLLVLSGGAFGLPIVFVLLTWLASLLPRALLISPWFQLVFVGFSLLSLVGEVTILILILLRSEPSPRLLRLLFAVMALSGVTMVVSLLSTVFWLLRLWSDVPQFATSQGLDSAGLLGNAGGSMGVGVVLMMMLLAIFLIGTVLRRGMRVRRVAIL